MKKSTSAAVVSGPLTPYAEGFRRHLGDLGYLASSIKANERSFAQLNRWMVAEGVELGDLTPEGLECFRANRRAVFHKDSIRLRALVDYLRVQEAIPALPVAGGPVVEVLCAYRRYMRLERRLADSTAIRAEYVVRSFLLHRAASGPLDLAGLEPGFLNEFVLSESARLSVGAMRSVIGALRPFLRFLFVTGVVGRDLSGALGSVASSRFASLPKAVDTLTVQALLDSCDQSTPLGLRDFAILTLMVRLGLRANEVASMRLDDLDWRAGELIVHGKARRIERLPLPADVGEALACYLRDGRPRSPSRAVFLRAVAPAGDMSRNAVVFVPRTASVRAGVAVVGAHRLRHTSATQMLRHGATLREVGQVLRHQDDVTTAVYAKVDRVRLDALVRPWPKGQA